MRNLSKCCYICSVPNRSNPDKYSKKMLNSIFSMIKINNIGYFIFINSNDMFERLCFIFEDEKKRDEIIHLFLFGFLYFQSLVYKFIK